MSDSAQPARLLRRALPYLTVAVALAVAYDGWTFFSRWYDAREAEKADVRKQVQDARRTLELLGGDQLKILSFYAAPTIHRGEHATICYGVNAAESVRIEPPVEQLHPAVSHCIQVSPLKDTDYKLIAQDHAGHVETQSLTIQVVP
ncbi:MAG TPA: hypothetical protein VK708_16885 [Bryobacteraceae bacterium]|nr:hypothetical protein [Bryobacteraceae bacterium]